MKALTLTQPWATLVAIGAKRIETRSWRTDYRGPLAIHAAKGKDKTGAVVTYPFHHVLRMANVEPTTLPLGAVVATCELVSVKAMPELLDSISGREWEGPGGKLYDFAITEQEKAFGNYAPGRYAWLLNNVKPLPEPIPARGALGLWEWDEAILTKETL